MLLGSPGAIAIFGANVKMNRDVYSSNCCFSAIVSQSGGCEMVWTVPWTPDLLGERSPRCQEHNPPYPPEFREQMVALVRSGRTPESLSREFEPSAQTIHIWVRQADLDQGRRTDNLTSAEREELRRLRRENKQLKIEREILKEAAVWFAQETGTVPLKRTDSRASTGPTIPFVRCVACWASPPAGYYAWRGRPPSVREVRNQRLLERMREIHTFSRQTYGRPRIYAELRDEGWRVNHKRVTRLTALDGLQGASRRKKWRTTKRDKDARPAPDLVDRDFAADRPDQLWVADIT